MAMGELGGCLTFFECHIFETLLNEQNFIRKTENVFALTELKNFFAFIQLQLDL